MFFLSWLLGKVKITFHHAQNTLSILVRGSEETSLSDLVKASTPDCWLNPLLFNGHLQTLWTSQKSGNVLVVYKRKLFQADKPAFAGTFAVDFVVQEKPIERDPNLPHGVSLYTEEESNALGSLDTRPMLICLHGLTGGSHEVYLRHVLHVITTSEGWEACVINSRGCARSKLTTDVLYNARATWDVRQLVKWLREAYPNRPLYAIGFSLGANIMTNYVGEEGEGCLLKAAVSVGNPFNLELCDLALRSSWMGREVYSKSLGASLRKLVRHHTDILSSSKRFSFKNIMATKYIHEFDREMQCPSWGYPTEGAYYRDASSTDALLGVRIPFLALNAEDDPVSWRENHFMLLLSCSDCCSISCSVSGGIEQPIYRPLHDFEGWSPQLVRIQR